MRIDVAAHILPARFYARLQQLPTFYMAERVSTIPCLYDLIARFRVMIDEGNIRRVLARRESAKLA